MIDLIGRIVAMWRPPQRVVDGNLMADQIRVDSVLLSRHDKNVSISVIVYEPLLGESFTLATLITPDLVVEKKGALGYHIIESLTKDFEAELDKHPQATEARQFHHHMKPR